MEVVSIHKITYNSSCEDFFSKDITFNINIKVVTPLEKILSVYIGGVIISLFNSNSPPKRTQEWVILNNIYNSKKINTLNPLFQGSSKHARSV